MVVEQLSSTFGALSLLTSNTHTQTPEIVSHAVVPADLGKRIANSSPTWTIYSISSLKTTTATKCFNKVKVGVTKEKKGREEVTFAFSLNLLSFS